MTTGQILLNKTVRWTLRFMAFFGSGLFFAIVLNNPALVIIAYLYILFSYSVGYIDGVYKGITTTLKSVENIVRPRGQ